MRENLNRVIYRNSKHDFNPMWLTLPNFQGTADQPCPFIHSGQAQRRLAQCSFVNSVPIIFHLDEIGRSILGASPHHNGLRMCMSNDVGAGLLNHTVCALVLAEATNPQH